MGSRNSYRLWTPAEIEQWAELVGECPFPLAMRRWNAWATAQGLPKRSAHSLQHKARDLKMSTMATVGDWVTIREICLLTGRHRTTISEWVEKGWVSRYVYGRASAVPRIDLRRMAREHPVALGGVERGNLVQLLEDEVLADAVLRQYPRPYRSCRSGQSVICVDRGQRFPSYSAAGKTLHMHPHTIRNAVLQDRPACGMRFRLG